MTRHDRLQRTDEAIVVATGAPREPGCPPWVVLGVNVIEERAPCDLPVTAAMRLRRSSMPRGGDAPSIMMRVFGVE
jgi:hypothetical protein